jgi:hypothetical protein
MVQEIVKKKDESNFEDFDKLVIRTTQRLNERRNSEIRKTNLSEIDFKTKPNFLVEQYEKF